MMKQLPLALAALSLGACAYTIDASDAFKPVNGDAYGPEGSLTIQDEDKVPASVTLTHQRLETAFGPMAVSLFDGPSDRLIVTCMGNIADRIKNGVDYADSLWQFGDVLLFDYPGYGDSGGEETVEDFTIAIRAALDHARSLGRRDMVAWGHSLGGFVCAQMVGLDESAFDAMIFEASARNAKEVGDSWKPWYTTFLIRVEVESGLEGFDSAQALEGYEGKVAVLSGGRDIILAPALQRDLADTLRAQGVDVTLMNFPTAGHDDISDQPDFAARIGDFVDTALSD